MTTCSTALSVWCKKKEKADGLWLHPQLVARLLQLLAEPVTRDFLRMGLKHRFPSERSLGLLSPPCCCWGQWQAPQGHWCCSQSAHLCCSQSAPLPTLQPIFIHTQPSPHTQPPFPPTLHTQSLASLLHFPLLPTLTVSKPCLFCSTPCLFCLIFPIHLPE